ncbi:MAG: RAMP superfamily CRISPR-associated protein [bacterium JZ-2024 1]
MASYQKFHYVGLALDPIHVGTGGARIGRVDLTIVRDPVTRVPKIPGSSLAGVYRTYVAMDFEEQRKQAQSQQSSQQPSQAQRQKPFYPDCAGLGQPRPDGTGGHCGQHDCPVCTVFGFARGKDQAGGFAGLAAFSDAHVLLFPAPTRRGPHWVTCPMALRLVGPEVSGVQDNAVYLEKASGNRLNLGWLLLEVKPCTQFQQIKKTLQRLGVPGYLYNRLALLPDDLFIHVVNSNLEVRTSVSINPETGAAEEGALFSYEALPRTTVLMWEVITKNPKHFKVGGRDVDVTLNGIQKLDSPDKVAEITKKAHPYLEHLGIGGMGTRGMGRLKVLCASSAPSTPPTINCGQIASASSGGQP